MRGQGIIDRARSSPRSRASGGSPPPTSTAGFTPTCTRRRLCQVAPIRPVQLAAGFDQARRAVLLRATKVVAEVSSGGPVGLRQLFRKRSSAPAARHPRDARWIPRGDRGPFSLFQAVTKYGLQLALALPAIAACGRAGGCRPTCCGARSAVRWSSRTGGDSGAPSMAAAFRPGLSDDVAALLERVAARDSGGSPHPRRRSRYARRGRVCPRLVLPPQARGRTQQGSRRRRPVPPAPRFISRSWASGPRSGLAPGTSWSSAACRTGSFSRSASTCASARPRSGDDLPGSLYVYARTLDARAVLDHVERLAARAQ